MTERDKPALETLWEDGDFVLSRSVGRAPMLLLAPSSTSPSSTTLARLKHAHDLRELLDSSWAARPRALVDHEGRRALILDDPGGQLLATLVGTPWKVGPFLQLALGVTRALRQLHERGIVHRDIKPAHILWNSASGEVWLTGFGIASQV